MVAASGASRSERLRRASDQATATGAGGRKAEKWKAVVRTISSMLLRLDSFYPSSSALLIRIGKESAKSFHAAVTIDDASSVSSGYVCSAMKSVRTVDVSTRGVMDVEDLHRNAILEKQVRHSSIHVLLISDCRLSRNPTRTRRRASQSLRNWHI